LLTDQPKKNWNKKNNLRFFSKYCSFRLILGYFLKASSVFVCVLLFINNFFLIGLLKTYFRLPCHFWSEWMTTQIISQVVRNYLNFFLIINHHLTGSNFPQSVLSSPNTLWLLNFVIALNFLQLNKLWLLKNIKQIARV
jgi:hypothetical protein